MKKIIEAIIKFFKWLFGIKDKPIDVPQETDNNEDEQEEVKCPEITIIPSDTTGKGGVVEFKVK